MPGYAIQPTGRQDQRATDRAVPALERLEREAAPPGFFTEPVEEQHQQQDRGQSQRRQARIDRELAPGGSGACITIAATRASARNMRGLRL